ncbi:DUF3040 domain-containing protein [Streptomyces resistomycificus]|uniref:DUF3040 domain-containing protein n=1 Tax=Streptomyces resistomycificus TaxID=67356 RepID=A0A0L8KYU1_9ACTN|nr:DUF3040 domain-containing protein [Streptomyces resistomycificus]KOG31020.1 hypothetical protein ADK37_32760 [Streptomyces resistomycificus]KUN96620.1 hypothetical protein AQJ84_19845 [Streptomyces resistomycificus]
MPQSDDELLVALQARFERDDPRFARAMSAGRPFQPREYRHTRAWWSLAVALAVLVAGVVVADGLLIATGLVLAGMAAQLFDPQRSRGRRCPPRR